MTNPSDSRRIIVIGNVNADVVYRVQGRLRSGQEMMAEALGTRLGGSGANAGSILAAAGDAVKLFGIVGQDPIGDLVLKLARERTWDLAGIERRATPTSTCMILLDETGDRTIIGIDRQNMSAPWPTLDIDAADAIYIAANRTIPKTTAARLAHGQPPVITQLKYAERLVHATAVVASELHFKAVESGKWWKAISKRGISTSWLVVTRGAAGAWASNGDVVLEVPALSTKSVDTTGAGDAFAAGLVYALARSWSMSEALALASLWGAYAVSHLGSAHPPGHPPPMDATPLT